MEQKTDRFYPSAPLEKNIYLEKRLEKNLNDVNSFNNSINEIKEVISHFKHKNYKSKKKNKKYKTIATILKSFDTILNYCHNNKSYYVESYRNRIDSDTFIDWNSMWNII